MKEEDCHHMDGVIACRSNFCNCEGQHYECCDYLIFGGKSVLFINSLGSSYLFFSLVGLFKHNSSSFFLSWSSWSFAITIIMIIIITIIISRKTSLMIIIYASQKNASCPKFLIRHPDEERDEWGTKETRKGKSIEM